jgi:hypothetical protein
MVIAKKPFVVGPFTMDAGKYYVGDLQHVFDCATWGEVVGCFESGGDMQGKFTLPNGRVCVMFDLPSNGYRRRDYDDMQGLHYYMNSSLIGITLAEGLEAEYKDINLSTCSRQEGEDFDTMTARMGNIIKYNDPFNCNSTVTVLKDGSVFGGDCNVAVIDFGDKVCIDTDESKEDDIDIGDDPAAFMRRSLTTMLKEGARHAPTAAIAKKTPKKSKPKQSKTPKKSKPKQSKT